MGSNATHRGVPVERLEDALRRLRSRARLLLLGRGVAAVLAVGLGAIIGVGVLDYFLRLPTALRWIAWMGGAAALLFALRSLLLPVARFRPSLSDLALRVEGTQSERPAGWLASALELRGDDDGSREARRLADEKLAQIGPWHVLEPARSARFGIGLAVAAVAAALLVALSPTLASIGASRVLAPWSDAAWPKRTEIADATPTGAVHPLGVSLDLAARLTRSPAPAGQSRIVAMVRLVEGGVPGETMRLPMTARADADDGEMYQRRVETPEEADGEITLEYWFVSLDDETEPRSITLAPTPEVASASIDIVPPAYSREVVAAGDRFFSGDRDLGAGADGRAIVGPVLAGSTYELEIELNKPLEALTPGETTPQWLEALLAGSAGADVTLGGDSVLVSGTIGASSRIEVELRDRHGLVNATDSAFSIDVVQDAEPSAGVTEPSHDEGVLASAVLDLTAEASDDVALEEVRLEHRVARPPRGSEGAPPEPEATATPIAVRSMTSEPAASRSRASLGVRLDLATLALNPGDELWITGVARDIYEHQGLTHEEVHSKPRRLLIIGEDQLIERLRRDLDAIREAARRLDGAQARVERQVERLGTSDGARDQQASIGEQIQAQREAGERIAQRMARNRLDDPALEGLVDDAAGALDAAASAASEAASEIEQSVEQGEQPGDNPQREREIEQAQEEVRDELGRLAEMLSRGQDGWLVRRGVERLLSEQRRLAEQTEAIGRATAGRSASDLSPQELSELDRIAQRQREAAEELDQTLDDLNERARQLEEVDPAQSVAMQQAAERGRNAQAGESMRDAAQQVQQNQTGSASQNQQQAIEALEEMLEDLDSASQNRDAALQRMLASVIESLEGLITQQERELAALDQAVAQNYFVDLDDGMVRLYTNALGVHDQVRTQGADMESVAGLLDQAIGAQETAIAGLRAEPVDEPRTREGEQASLAGLKEALAEATRLQEEAAARDQARKLAELRRAYRNVLEQQVALRGETEPMAGRTLNRRDRQAARTLGEQQDALRITLSEIREGTEEFDDASMFDYAHRRLDGLMESAAQDLREGAPAAGTLRRQSSSVSVLQSLIEAIEQAESEDDPFRAGAGGQSGQSGGQSGGDQPLLPPAAELKLLRSMQAEALSWTRVLDESESADPAELRLLGELQSDLRARGEELIEKMFQNQQQQMPNMGGEDRP